jgi:16S rRNA (cytosine1402-N4)-methyltransferase
MPQEVLTYLAPRPGGCYVDGTLGGGGHAGLILDVVGPEGTLIGFDRDRDALEAASKSLSGCAGRFVAIHGDFADMVESLQEMGISRIDGFLLDLGVSSHQLDSAERGFSFQREAPLDMRMDRSSGETAAQLVNELPEEELARIISQYGEERFARRIASFIVKARSLAPISTTQELAGIIGSAIPRRFQDERIHPATRTFQAIRIVVNDELGSLARGVRGGFSLLGSGGRGVVISFHSLEDRMVKQIFREYATGCRCPKDFPRCVCGIRPTATILTGRPVTATPDEVAVNPRARSAKLRAIEKV